MKCQANCRFPARWSARYLWRPTGGNSKNERYQSAGLAGRYPRLHSNLPGSRPPDLLPWNWTAVNNAQQKAARWRSGRMFTRSIFVAAVIGENLEFFQVIASTSDNIDCGETIHAHDGSEERMTPFTDRA
jgi:hypothetical protein